MLEQIWARALLADGVGYIILKAIRDFTMVFAALVGTDGFELSTESLTKAAIAAGSTTLYRVAREVIDRFGPTE